MSKKVTFIKGAMATVVWDPKANKPMAEFVNGLFETSDKRVIDALLSFGYQMESDYPYGPPPEGFVPKKSEMAPPKPISNLIPSTLKPDVPDAEDVSPAKKPDIRERVTNQKSEVKRKTLKRRTKSE